ncbi:MAG: ABC transporter substrate-binding protein [Proteobacteria bacterium]|nr:ABC transporter substrate-binding protein [Pseudomonadota bacterium]
MIAFGAALAAVGLVSAAGPAAAQFSDDMIKIGVLTDMTGVFSDLAGQGSVDAARIAVEELGGRVRGKKIEVIFADHQHKADIGTSLARQWYERDGVDLIVDVPNSGIALAVQEIARKAGKLVVYSSAAVERLTQDVCSPTGLHWVYDTYSQANVLGRVLVGEGYDTWYMLVADFAFGHAMQATMEETVKAAGGKVVGSARHPLGLTDFSSFLLQARASNAKMIMLGAGGNDTVNAIKQGAEFGIFRRGQKMVFPITFAHEIYALGLPLAQGMQFIEGFYWDFDDRTRGFAKKMYDKIGRQPSSVHAGVYSATLNVLKAMDAANTDDGLKVMAQLRSMTIDDAFARNGKVLPNGRFIHDMYLVKVKTPEESKNPWDLYTITRTIPADQAFRPLADSTCPLVKK